TRKWFDRELLNWQSHQSLEVWKPATQFFSRVGLYSDNTSESILAYRLRGNHSREARSYFNDLVWLEVTNHRVVGLSVNRFKISIPQVKAMTCFLLRKSVEF